MGSFFLKKKNKCFGFKMGSLSMHCYISWCIYNLTSGVITVKNQRINSHIDNCFQNKISFSYNFKAFVGLFGPFWSNFLQANLPEKCYRLRDKSFKCNLFNINALDFHS